MEWLVSASSITTPVKPIHAKPLPAQEVAPHGTVFSPHDARASDQLVMRSPSWSDD